MNSALLWRKLPYGNYNKLKASPQTQQHTESAETLVAILWYCNASWASLVIFLNTRDDNFWCKVFAICNAGASITKKYPC